MSVSGGFDGWQRVDDGSSLSGSADRGFTNDDMRHAETIEVFPHLASGIELPNTLISPKLDANKAVPARSDCAI